MKNEDELSDMTNKRFAELKRDLLNPPIYCEIKLINGFIKYRKEIYKQEFKEFVLERFIKRVPTRKADLEAVRRMIFKDEFKNVQVNYFTYRDAINRFSKRKGK